MKVGVLRVELYVPGVGSLKEKRKIVRSIKDRIRNTFNASVAEVDHQDKWQRAALGLATVGTDNGYVRGTLEEILKFLRGQPAVQMTFHEMETL